ncbi:MAG TPA: hypothetical protein VKY65_01830 [Alphaproteobacteria bacterium]|nr:hypothetical protein [Alphaproteobacteria bacterium]
MHVGLDEARENMPVRSIYYVTRFAGMATGFKDGRYAPVIDGEIRPNFPVMWEDDGPVFHNTIEGHRRSPRFAVPVRQP